MYKIHAAVFTFAEERLNGRGRTGVLQDGVADDALIAVSNDERTPAKTAGGNILPVCEAL